MGQGKKKERKEIRRRRRRRNRKKPVRGCKRRSSEGGGGRSEHANGGRHDGSGTLVSGNIRFVRIFARVLQKRGVKGQWGRALTLVLNIFSWVRKRKIGFDA